MKKLLSSIFILACCAAFAQAEELKFVTTLSHPVASFARLESVNSARPAEALFVNFCNTGVPSGTISAKGLVKMNELRLTEGSRVGSSSQLTYQITNENGLTIASRGSLRGAKLLAKTANPQDITVDAGVNVGADSTFAAADLNRLQIASHTTIVPSDDYSKGYTMVWDNSYKADYKITASDIKEVGKTYDSYLLRYRSNKEDVSLISGCSACSAYELDSTAYENCVLKNVTSCCSYAESIYTKLGKNSYEEMKKTSCYDCSHRVASGTDVINENISLSVSDLQYITGDMIPSSYANTEIDCMDKGFPLGNGKGWQSFTKCSADGTCAGSDSCVKRCKITACRPQYIGGKINEYWCHVNSVNLACLCSRNGW